jgi:hypothetical protein
MDAEGRATQEQLPRKQERDGSPFFWSLFFGEAKKSDSPAGEKDGYDKRKLIQIK